MTSRMTVIETHPDNAIDGQKGRKYITRSLKIYQFISGMEREGEKESERD